MANKPARRDSRIRTPPEKKRSKGFERLTPPATEEPVHSTIDGVLSRADVQALAIRAEDLEKLHAPRPLQDEQRPPATSRLLVRKLRPPDKTKKTQLVVARPTTSDAAMKGLDHSEQMVPHVDALGQILPHSILGSLQELKREAATRGNTQLAELITDSPAPSSFPQPACKDEPKEEEKTLWAPPKQHKALENWNYHMGLRKLQMGYLSQQLGTPTSELLMNLSEDYRLVQEERNLIDRCIPAVDYGKGYRAGSEFWNPPMYIGDELTGLTVTQTQQERGYAEPFIHVRKPSTVKAESGTRLPPERKRVHATWDKSLYRLRRRHELQQILEELNFTVPEVNGLEVIGKGRPFTSQSVWNQDLNGEEEEILQTEKENLDPLEDYPDVVPEIIIGPSLQFCGQPARWIGSNCSHREQIGISARVTFEAVAGDKATSVLQVTNDGTAAIWYEWRRNPHPTTLAEICTDHRLPRFYFNTSSGVILPGDTKSFSFLFKSLSPGIFSESWEFCTHPVLLGGASMQLSLFGIAVYEDKTSELRQALQRELEAREAMVIAAEMLQKILDGVRSPERPWSPMNTYITEEEIFHSENPHLFYKDQVVRELHQLWKHFVDTAPGEEDDDSKNVPVGEVMDSKIFPTREVREIRSLAYVEVRDSITRYTTEISRKIVPAVEFRDSKISTSTSIKDRSGPIFHPLTTIKSSILEESKDAINRAAEEAGGSAQSVAKFEGPPSTWHLSLVDLKKALLSLPDDVQREAALSQLNKAIVDLSFPQEESKPNLLYHMCLQQWRGVIDALVTHSIFLRSILGLPEKEPQTELVQEESVDLRKAGKGGKEDRKAGAQKEEKRNAAAREREEKKAAAKLTARDKAADKEERPGSRKGKGKEDKKIVRTTPHSTNSREQLYSTDSLYPWGGDSKIQQADLALQTEYQEKLYIQVYGLLTSLVDNLVFFSEELKEIS